MHSTPSSTSPAPAAVPLPLAGLPRRLGAIFYDALLLLATLFFATAILLPLTGGKAVASPGEFNPWYTSYLFCICFLFFGWFWTHGGQTLGMRAWKIRVQRLDGGAITWGQALTRFLLGGLWLLPMFVLKQVLALDLWLSAGIGAGFLLLTLVGRLHDRYSNSVVVRLKPRKQK